MNPAELTFLINQKLFLHSTKARVRLWKKLAKLISNQVLILSALELMKRQRAEISGSEHQEVIALGSWIMKMHNGAKLSEAIKGWVTEGELMLIAAGETSGELESVLISTTLMMESKGQIQKAILGGVIYPLFLTILAFLVLYLFGFKVVPQFNKIVGPDKWHGLAAFVAGISEFTRAWLFHVAALIVALIIAFFISLPRFDGRLRIALDRFPPYSIYRVIQGSSWLIGTAFMVKAGVRIEPCLEQQIKMASPWLAARLRKCLSGMRAGLNMGDALRKSDYRFPDREVIGELSVYASLNGLDKAIEILGREWMEEAVNQIKARMAIVFGVSLLMVTVLVALMVGGMMDMQIQMAKVLQSSYR